MDGSFWRFEARMVTVIVPATSAVQISALTFARNECLVWSSLVEGLGDFRSSTR
jgi:hypothetical protein